MVTLHAVPGTERADLQPSPSDRAASTGQPAMGREKKKRSKLQGLSSFTF